MGTRRESRRKAARGRGHSGAAFVFVAAFAMISTAATPASANATITPANVAPVVTWAQPPLTAPPSRFEAASAVDGTGKLIVFGGRTDGGPIGDTWAWDGATGTWSNQTPTPATSLNTPSRRFGAAMARDKNGNLVLFGGLDANGSVLDDTWSRTGTTWKPLSLSPRPPPRWAASVATDSVGRIVLFGGWDANDKALGDTWTWDGTTWANVTPASLTATNSPSARTAAAMAYHPGTAKTVLVGGDDGDEQPLGDTWAWDGSTSHWAQVMVTGPSPARFDASMSADVAGNLVLFGGYDPINDVILNETWSWDGSAWTNKTATTPTASNTPLDRTDASLAFLPASGKAVLFGGRERFLFALGDTWSWNGSGWSLNQPAASPPARQAAAMASGPNGTAVLFGGGKDPADGSSPILNDTWVWDGTAWVEKTPPVITASNSPTRRIQSTMAYDGVGKALLFGGRNQDVGTLRDTWVWNGSAWSNVTPPTLTPTNSPSARSSTAMAGDGADHVLLFGGVEGPTGNALGDFWSWNNGAWTDITPPPSTPSKVPPPRYSAAMAFDPATQQVVLFGGFGAGDAALGDTWVWTASNGWTNMTSVGPPDRFGASMAYDPGTSRLVLFGGSPGNAAPFNDTWEWTGTTWEQAAPVVSPPVRVFAGSAQAGNHIALFGGTAVEDETSAADTWLFGSPPLVTTSPLSQTVVTGQAATFTADAVADPAASVQWQVAASAGFPYKPITGATSKTLTVPGNVANTGKLYRAVFTNLFGSATSGGAKLTVNRAATKVTLSQIPMPTAVGNPMTIIATVQPVPPGAGTPNGVVTFQWGGVNGSLIANPVPLNGGKASITIGAPPPTAAPSQGLIAPGPPITAVYQGDPNFLISNATFNPAIQVDNVVTGGSTVNLTNGSTVLTGHVTGYVNISGGAKVVIVGATVDGGITAHNSGTVIVCSSTIKGWVSITGAKGFVEFGGDDGCGGNTLQAGLTLSSNTASAEVSGNHIGGGATLNGTTGTGPYPEDVRLEVEANSIAGGLSCSGNNPTPINDGTPNSVAGYRSGQCAASGF